MSKITFIKDMRKIIRDKKMAEIKVETGEDLQFIVNESRIIFPKDFFNDDFFKFNPERVLFKELLSLKKVDMSNLDFSEVSEMHKWFYGNSNLEEVIFPDEMVCPKLTDLSRCFTNTKIKYLDLSNWQFGDNSINMENFISFNSNIEKLVLPKAKILSLCSLVSNCNKLKEVDFNESEVVNFEKENSFEIFLGCHNLEMINRSKMKNSQEELYSLFDWKTSGNFEETKESLCVILPQ